MAEVSVKERTVPGRPAGELPKVRIRHWGRYLSAVIILGLLALLGIALGEGDIDYAQIPDLITADIMLQGLKNTIVLAIVAQGAAVIIGVVIALMRISTNPVARWVAWFYTWIFRGLPVLLQIVLWYNLALVFPVIRIGIPFTDINVVDQPANVLVTAFTAALLGLGLNESAYMAEIVRAGLSSVDKGQTEAAQAIGMPPLKVLRRVVLPQAMRVIIPPTGNDFINMLKGTSIASVIGFVELVKASNNLSSRSLAVVETLMAAAIESASPRAREAGRPADHLREDLVDGALAALTQEGLGEIRDAATFAQRRDAIATGVFGEAMQRLRQAEAILSLVAEVRARLDSKLVGWARGNLDDMQAQLSALVPPGFLRDVPATALGGYPRYLKALSVRAERALNDPVRDQQRMLDLKPFADALANARTRGVVGDPDWQALRWDLEELRVSLFAQEVGAKGGVSAKKLAQRLAALAARGEGKR